MEFEVATIKKKDYFLLKLRTLRIIWALKDALRFYSFSYWCGENVFETVMF